jgi:hypothetical protein
VLFLLFPGGRRPDGIAVTAAPPAPPWDLPARMLIAAAFVVLLTTYAAALGPQLSGLFSPFPVFGLVIAVFTHRQLGARAAGRMLRGVVLGSLAFGAFFLVVGGLLGRVGATVAPGASGALVAVLPVYLVASFVALGINGFSLRLAR